MRALISLFIIAASTVSFGQTSRVGDRAVATIVGRWSSYINSLPDLQLPHVPIVGNGHLGVALDSRSKATSASGNGTGPGAANALDAWIDTTSMWSCTTCGSVDPDHDVAGCCSTIALGGLSVRFTPTFPATQPLPSFEAEQRIAGGTLYTRWNTSNGGSIETLTYVHPSLDVVVTNITSWTPGAGDPSTLLLDASTWVLGNGAIQNSWNTGTPAPSAVGCASSSGGNGSTCDSANDFVFVTRNASTVDEAVMPVMASLATGILLGPGAQRLNARITAYAPGYPPTSAWEASQRIAIPAGSWAAVVTAEAETRGAGLSDPAPAAVALLAQMLASPPTHVADAAEAWWGDFWEQSSISLPSQPLIEQYWYGAQYVLACASSSTSDDDHAAPGLYGPWVTADGPNWHGDYTLDYNYNAPYFGVFSSNHPQQAEAFWRPVVDWMGPASIKAQAQAGYAHVDCPANALYYACHLSPWGLMSLDPMTKYMTWNGHYTALLFINHWEYTRNATFAANVTYPLLDGLNAWWACYLNKTSTGPAPGDYLYMDNNWANPDYEHEGQPVPNPQIALGFIYRTITAQLDIASTLGLQPPSVLLDIAAHLPPLNFATVNYTTNVTFQTLPNTRCRNDEATWYDVGSAADCQALCASSQPSCGAYSYCPPADQQPPPTGGGCSGTNGEPKPNTCWGYDIAQVPNCVTNATLNAGWTSGARNGTSPPTQATIWTGYQGASEAQSDWFAMYPLWPTEALDLGPQAWNQSTGDAVRPIAQSSSRLYSDFANGRPVDLFAAAVLAGHNASFPLAWTPSDVLKGLNSYLDNYFGANLLPYAPGGGIENTGITRAVNDMLVQANRLPAAPGGLPAAPGAYVLTLFPFWPGGEPASFQNLLAKCGFLVSAGYDNVTQSVVSPISITAAYTVNDAATSTVALVCPWPTACAAAANASLNADAAPASSAAVSVSCGGSIVPVTWSGSVLSFAAPAGVPCTVGLQSNNKA